MKKLIQKWLGIVSLEDKMKWWIETNLSEVKGMALVDVKKIYDRLDSIERKQNDR